jgi:PAS domain S-box-containing protein
MSPLDQPDIERFHLAAIVDSADDAIVSKDLDGIIQTWNAGAERLFGYTADEVVGRPVTMLMPPDRVNEEPGILARIARGERIEHYETVRRRKDGTLVEVSLSISPIRDLSGRVIGASKIGRNISERRQAEETAAYLAAIVSSSTDAIVGKTLDGIVRSWNGAAERLFGYRADEAIGRSITLIVPPERLHEEDDVLRRIRRGERVEHYETVRVRKDGTEVEVSLTISPVRNAAGDIIGASKIARDITERRLYEKEREVLLAREREARAEAEAVNRAKDDFLATLSHELRTPLNAILGWGHVLDRGRTDPKIVERALDTIMRSARQQAQLVEDLLDLSSIISGRFRLNPRPVDLVAVLTAALESVRPAIEAKGLRVETQFDPSVGAVSGDPGRLEQVFWNLLSNSAKFTPKGGTVRVRLAGAPSRAIVTVSDTGIGIRPDVLPSIFDRFRQGDSSITRAHGGLGLGLAIVKQLVELHGGTAEGSSPGEGLGATFTVSLPVMAVRTTGRPGRVARLEPSARCDGLTVLVVDDDPDGRELIALLLRDCGAEVTVAGSAAEALSALERVRPGVLISDLAMPGVDGYELARRVRASPHGANVAALALTAHANAEARANAFVAGFDTYVAKPVDPVELVAAVVRLGRRATAPPRSQTT